MKTSTSIESFKKFAEDYVPFPWEIDNETHQKDVKGKHSVLGNLIRYWHVVGYLESISHQSRVESVIDIGSYPGTFIKILKHFLGKNVRYTGVGLGFSDEYKLEMEKLGGTLFETELDPEFVQPKIVKDWPFSDVDCCIFLDVIEHLVNPIDCLDRINKSLRMGGQLIITTDNITALGYIVPMLRRGESPNIPPLRSHLFYRGDWRPHFKELSRSELAFFLEYCGFKLGEHQYFEREQGDYYFNDKGRVYRQSRYKGFKGLIRKILLRYLPHLRDHQILVATKAVELEDQVKKRPVATQDMHEWLKMRERFGL
jgi:SAM-dependent methyltransferase